jgi:plastocyanin
VHISSRGLGRAALPRDVAALVFVLALAVGVGTGCGGSAHASPSCASVIGPLAPVTQKHDRVGTGSTLDVDAANSAFDPTCVTHVSRGTVAVTFHNTGLVIHNVEITAQHIDVDVKPRGSVTIRIQVGADPVVYVCRYHRALGMVGVLIPASS